MIDADTQLDRIESALRTCNAGLRLQHTMTAALLSITTAQGAFIMARIDEVENELAGLRTDVDTLTETIDAEGVQVGAVVTELQSLREAIANGAMVDPARLDALLTQTQEIRSRLQSARNNVSGLVPDAPPAEG